VHRADYRIAAAACRFAAPTFKANEPFAMRQLMVANRRYQKPPPRFVTGAAGAPQ
jgi:hypothetical protein